MGQNTSFYKRQLPKFCVNFLQPTPNVSLRKRDCAKGAVRLVAISCFSRFHSYGELSKLFTQNLGINNVVQYKKFIDLKFKNLYFNLQTL
jgi:hypothetical protein